MIDPRYYGLVELVLVMLLVIGFAIWQLRELKQLERKRREDAARDRENPD